MWLEATACLLRESNPESRDPKIQFLDSNHIATTSILSSPREPHLGISIQAMTVAYMPANPSDEILGFMDAFFTDRFKCLEHKESSLKGIDDSEYLKSLNLDIIWRYNNVLRLGYQHRDMSVGNIIYPKRPRQSFHIVDIKPSSE
jgi:hypothetical protein